MYQPQASSIVHRTWTGDSFHIWYYTYFNAKVFLRLWLQPCSLCLHFSRISSFVSVSSPLLSYRNISWEHLPLDSGPIWMIQDNLIWKSLFTFTKTCSQIRLCSQVLAGGSGGKESACNAGDLSSTPQGLGRSPGKGNGNPLQYSCLENPMDREAWWATVHGVTKIRHNWVTFTQVLGLGLGIFGNGRLVPYSRWGEEPVSKLVSIHPEDFCFLAWI